MKNNKTHDAVNHPKHYTNSSLECIQVMEMTFGIDSTYDYCLMNAFKYMWRHKEKNGLEDLKKARWYVNHAIELKPDGFLHANVDRLLRDLEKDIVRSTDESITRNRGLKPVSKKDLDDYCDIIESALRDGTLTYGQTVVDEMVLKNWRV